MFTVVGGKGESDLCRGDMLLALLCGGGDMLAAPLCCDLRLVSFTGTGDLRSVSFTGTGDGDKLTACFLGGRGDLALDCMTGGDKLLALLLGDRERADSAAGTRETAFPRSWRG